MFCTEMVYFAPVVWEAKSVGKTYGNYLKMYYIDGILETSSIVDIYVGALN